MGLYETFHPIVLLWSFLWGAIIYIIYDFLRAVRYINKNKMWVSVLLDILFCVISACVVFMFSLAYNFGETRIYMLVGMLISFLTLRFTVGRLTVVIICRIYSIFSKIVKKIFLILKKVTTKVLKLFVLIVYNLIKIKRKIFIGIKNLFQKKGQNDEEKRKGLEG